MSRLQTAVISGLGVALVASGVIILHQSRKLTEVRRQRNTARESLRESREALHQAKLRWAAAMRRPPKPVNDDKPVIARQKATIQQLTSKLSAAQASVAQLQQQLSSTKDLNDKALAASSQKYQQMQTQLQSRLDKLQQELSSTQAKVQSSSQRIADLQKQNDQLQNSNSEGFRRLAKREHIFNKLQELDRRRQSYLSSIADRYRNLTSQFRNMSGMMDSNRGQNSSALSGPALDMIQNAISLSESDFQHLSSLNARAYHLLKQLSKN